MGSQGSPKPSTSTSDQSIRLISHNRLVDLLKEVDPTLQMDDDVEEMLNQLADEFIDSTLDAACALAKHRQAPTIEVKDVQLHLERQWNMSIPGYGTEEIRQYKRQPVVEAHKQRMALIKKSTKK